MKGLNLKNGLLLSGFKGSGKDTLADMVIREISKQGVNVKKYALAYRLKQASALMASRSIADLDDRVEKERIFESPLVITDEMVDTIFEVFKMKRPNEASAHVGKEMRSLRHLMQYAGTEIMRSTRPDIHCEKTHEVILKEKPDFFIISDNRFMNEITYFNNCEKVFVDRKSVEPKKTPDLHPSELMMFDIRDNIRNIDNNSTLEAFESNSMEVVNMIANFVIKKNLC